jgi:hypothetical protein
MFIGTGLLDRRGYADWNAGWERTTPTEPSPGLVGSHPLAQMGWSRTALPHRWVRLGSAPRAAALPLQSRALRSTARCGAVWWVEPTIGSCRAAHDPAPPFSSPTGIDRIDTDSVSVTRYSERQQIQHVFVAADVPVVPATSGDEVADRRRSVVVTSAPTQASARTARRA